jgi:hypothetical protein
MRSLPDRYPDLRPVLDGVGKDFLRLAKTIAGTKQAIDSHAVPRPLLDLVEIAIIRAKRIVGLFRLTGRSCASHQQLRHISRYSMQPDRSYLPLCDYFDLGSRSRSSICHNGENDGLFDAIQFDREPLRGGLLIARAQDCAGRRIHCVVALAHRT